jgi:hypothetical protein
MRPSVNIKKDEKRMEAGMARVVTAVTDLIKVLDERPRGGFTLVLIILAVACCIGAWALQLPEA